MASASLRARRACSNPVLGRADQADAGIGFGVSFEDGLGGVGGAVIDDDEFEIGECLREDAVYGQRNVGRRVVHGHKDRHCWIIRH